MRAQASRQVSMTVSELALPLVGATLGGLSWRAPLAAQGVLVPLAFVGFAVLDDARRRHERASAPTRPSSGSRCDYPGCRAVLLAGFLRFWCKFALVAYLPTMLVQRHGRR